MRTDRRAGALVAALDADAGDDHLPLAWPRIALTGAALVLGLALLWDRLQQIDGAAILSALSLISPPLWALAGLASLLSFRAMARFETVLHRHLGLSMAQPRLARGAMAATALSQLVGIGIVTGTLARSRAFPEIGLAMALRLTFLASLAFLLAWWLLVLLAGVLSGAFGAAGGLAILAALALMGAFVALRPLLRPTRLRWISPGDLGALILWVGLDAAASGMSLYLLSGMGLPPGAFFLAFLTAFGLSLLLASPAGIGVFDALFLALLPPHAVAPVLAGLLVWRILHFLLPGLMGFGYLLVPDPPAPRSRLAATADPDFHNRIAGPEGALARLHGHRVLPLLPGGWMIGRAGRHQVALFDPYGLPSATAFRALQDAARRSGGPVLGWRVGPRIAALARAAGWRVTRVSREAILCPPRFRLDRSACAGLRRKIRRAEAAGVTVSEETVLSPQTWAALQPVAREWLAQHGGECGFVMGRFHRPYLAAQRLFVARIGDSIVGMASFHASQHGWVLDVMRHPRLMPDGTMHLILAAAIRQAAQEAVPRLSLACAPMTAFADGPLRWSRALRRLGGDPGTGLAQFKSSFAPRWEPRFAISPRALSLGLGLLALRRAVVQPRPIVTAVHDLHEETAIALVDATWHEGENPAERPHDHERPVQAA